MDVGGLLRAHAAGVIPLHPSASRLANGATKLPPTRRELKLAGIPDDPPRGDATHEEGRLAHRTDSREDA